MGDALFEFFEPRKNRTPEEIALDDELENDIPAWPTPEYIQKRLEELNAMPPSPDVTAEELWLTRPTEKLAQLATSYRAVRDFTGPTLADQKAAQRASCDNMNTYKAEAEATYVKAWEAALIECINGKGAYPFQVDIERNQKETAKVLRNAAKWPDEWSNHRHDSTDLGKWNLVPSVRMIARKIQELEIAMGKALYKHKPGPKHHRCRFCPSPRS
ncbi:MAG: hypothetical protein KIT40_12010 [Nitrospira sp.]|nr:hypothetical protein [Nitrospira sp.]